MKTAIPETAAAAPAAVVSAVRPDRIEIADLTYRAMPAAAALLRDGYIFCPQSPPEVFVTGYCNIFLVRGEPDAQAIALAEAAEAIALARQQAAHERAAAVAARESAEAAERAEKEAAAQAEIESHRKAIARLQRSIRDA